MDDLRTYSEALDQQLNLIKVWSSSKGEQWIEAYPTEMFTKTISKKVLLRDLVYKLENADPYFITHHICTLLEGTYIDYPDVPLTADLLPTESGWVYLDKPIPLGPLSNIEKSPFGNPPRLKAFSWDLESIVVNTQEIRGITLIVYEDGIPYPYPLEINNWPFGTNWGQDWENIGQTDIYPVEPEVAKQRAIASRKLIMALLTFMSQKLLIISHGRASRAVRHRYQQERHQEAPLIKLVVLRARKSFAEQGEGKEVEWSCRWIVRGHWRQQWYSSIGIHKALWVMPYVKGPEDKPLKRPAANLFAVAR